MYNFTLDAGEISRYNQWMIKHDRECPFSNPNKQGAIGGRMTYSFCPTGIGVVVKIKCACGAIEDITDYLSW